MKTPNSASLPFVRVIYRWSVNYSHKRPVTRKMFPFDDVIMVYWCRTSDRKNTNVLTFPIISQHRWPLLLKWFNFNPSMDKYYGMKCQFKCPLAWFKWRAGYPLFDFVFREGGSQCEGGIDPDARISPCANRMGKHAFQTHFDGKIYQWKHIC